MNKLNFLTITIISVAISIWGCATIPSEAPELSVELGKRIAAIEKSNITLLHRFFDHKRNDVDEFIENEWVPLFAEEFFSDPTIAEAWNTIVRENDKNERLKFLIKTGPRLQKKINTKRIELISPLDDLERSIEQNLRAEYAQTIAMNNSITSFLISAAEVTENRNRYLEMVGITDEKVNKIIDQTDLVVNKLLQGAKDVDEKTEAANEYINKIRTIIDSIK